jgi:hypothetical protein
MENIKKFNWKQFVKPTKLKIFIFLLFPGIYVFYTFSMTMGDPWGYTYSIYPMFLMLTIFASQLFQSVSAPKGAYPIDAQGNPAVPLSNPLNIGFQIILNIIVVYLIACLIAHVIYKFRK